MVCLVTKGFLFDIKEGDPINGVPALVRKDQRIAAVLQLPENWGLFLIYGDYNFTRAPLEKIAEFTQGRKPCIVKVRVDEQLSIFEYEVPEQWAFFQRARNGISRRHWS